MKTYRVRLRRNDLSPRVFTWDVDAAHPGAAINKALKNIAAGSGDIDISIRLLSRHATMRSRPAVRDAAPGALGLIDAAGRPA